MAALSLPWDVVLECAVSLCVGVVGCVLWSGGALQGIVAAPTFHSRATDSLYEGGQWELRSLSHRGRALKAVRKGRGGTDLLPAPVEGEEGQRVVGLKEEGEGRRGGGGGGESTPQLRRGG